MARYVDPTFEIGMALGNAYGNMWTANAKKRQEEKAERLIFDMMGGNVTSEDVNAAITSGTGVLGQQNQVTAQDVRAAINGWPVGLTADAMRTNLRKNNINQEVIDKVMPRYEKQMRDDMTAKFLPQIIEGAYGKDSKLGSAVEQIIKMREYDPNLSNWLMNIIPTAKDVYNQEGRMALKGMGLGNLKGAGSIGQPNASWYSAILGEIKDLEAKQGYGELSPADAARLAGLYAMRDQIVPPVYGAPTSTPEKTTEKGVWDKAAAFLGDLFSPDEPAVSAAGSVPKDAADFIAQASEMGYSKQQIIDGIRKNKMYGDNTEAVINGIDWSVYGL